MSLVPKDPKLTIVPRPGALGLIHKAENTHIPAKCLGMQVTGLQSAAQKSMRDVVVCVGKKENSKT